MNGNSAVRHFAHTNELPHYVIGRTRAIDEVHVVVIEPGLSEAGGIVQLLIQTNHRRNIVSSKVVEVSLWGMQRVAIFHSTFGVRAAKSQEFLG